LGSESLGKFAQIVYRNQKRESISDMLALRLDSLGKSQFQRTGTNIQHVISGRMNTVSLVRFPGPREDSLIVSFRLQVCSPKECSADKVSAGN